MKNYRNETGKMLKGEDCYHNQDGSCPSFKKNPDFCKNCIPADPAIFGNQKNTGLGDKVLIGPNAGKTTGNNNTQVGVPAIGKNAGKTTNYMAGYPCNYRAEYTNKVNTPRVDYYKCGYCGKHIPGVRNKKTGDFYEFIACFNCSGTRCIPPITEKDYRGDWKCLECGKYYNMDNIGYSNPSYCPECTDKGFGGYKKMKIYCKGCKWLYQTFNVAIGNHQIHPQIEPVDVNNMYCGSPKNGAIADSWYSEDNLECVLSQEKQRQHHPSALNKNNDCKWFEEKE